jgi:hypothetical protein
MWLVTGRILVALEPPTSECFSKAESVPPNRALSDSEIGYGSLPADHFTNTQTSNGSKKTPERDIITSSRPLNRDGTSLSMRFARICTRRLPFTAPRPLHRTLITPRTRTMASAGTLSDDASQMPKKEEETPLPKLSPAEFKQYNRFADMMDSYVFTFITPFFTAETKKIQSITTSARPSPFSRPPARTTSGPPERPSGNSSRLPPNSSRFYAYITTSKSNPSSPC